MKLKIIESRLSVLKPFKKPKVNLEQYATPIDIVSRIIYTAQNEYNDIKDKNILDLCAGTGFLGIGTILFGPKSVSFLECDSLAVEELHQNLILFITNNEKNAISRNLAEPQSEREIRNQNVQFHYADKNVFNKQNQTTPSEIDKNSQTSILEHTPIKKDVLNQIRNALNSNSDGSEVQNDFQDGSVAECIVNCSKEFSLENLLNKDYDLSLNVFVGKYNEFNFDKQYFDTILMNPPFGTKTPHADVDALKYALRVGKVVYSLHKSSTRRYLLTKFPNSKVIATIKFDIPNLHKFHKKKCVSVDVDLIRFGV